MYRVTCNQCGASVITPDGNSDALACACCPEAHSHEANANACPGAGLNHAGARCPRLHPADCVVVTGPGEDCPGGHCALGVKGCQVCRPCTITWTGTVLSVPAVVQARG